VKLLAVALVSLTLAGTESAAPRVRQLGIAGTSDQYLALRSLHPSIRADYIEFGEDLTSTLQADRRLRATAMITWTDNAQLTLAQIAAGRSDGYVRRMARAVRSYRGLVYIRLAQEMNGNWFPWSGDPAAYVDAWRHIWAVFHGVGASNVRWIWGPDLLTYDTPERYAAVTAPYWPGSQYVNIVGPTMVEFQYESNCEVACRFTRITWLHATFGKPVWLAETKVDAAERYAWLQSLAPALAAAPWVTAVIWSETASRGEAAGQPGVGDMDWSLTNDPQARRLLRQALGRAARSTLRADAG
jgi:hypothetical protein